MSADPEVQPGLFKDIKFCLIDDVDQQEEVKQLLLDGGGKLINYLSDMVTHVIADNPDSPDVSEAQELFEKPVVTGRWVLLSAKCNALLPLSGFLPSRNQLFSGISAYPTQMSDNDTNAVWAMITFYGGTFQLDMNETCTHLIAAKPEGEIYETALEHYDQIKIVTPDWVVDSVKNKMLSDEDLYHPRLLMLPEAEQPNPPETISLPRSFDISHQQTVTTPTTAGGVSLKMLLFPSQPSIGIPNMQPGRELSKAVTIGEGTMMQGQVLQQSPRSAAEGFVRTALSSLPPQQQQQLLQHLHQQQLQKQAQLQAQQQQQQNQTGIAQLSPLQQHQLQQHILIARQKQQQAADQAAMSGMSQEGNATVQQGITLKQPEQARLQIQFSPNQQQQHVLQQQFSPQNQQFQGPNQNQPFSPPNQQQQNQVQRMPQQQQQQQQQFSPQGQQSGQPQFSSQQQALIQQRLQWQMQQGNPQQRMELTLAQQQQMQQILQLKCQRQMQLQRAQSPGGQIVLQQKQLQQPQNLPRPGQPKQIQFPQQAFQQVQQTLQGQPPVQRPPPQQLLQQQQHLKQQQQLLALQQMQQRQQLQQQQNQTYSAVQPTAPQSPGAGGQQQISGQPPQVIMKPPPQYPYPERTPMSQLTGQPRIQFPNQVPQTSQGQRMPWQQQQQGAQQQSVLLQQPRQLGPRIQQVSPTRPWSGLPQSGPKEEITQNQQLLKQQQQLLWQQRQIQQQKQDQPRTQVPQQHPAWQQQQQQPPPTLTVQQPSQQQTITTRDGTPVTQQQILQWQQLKQLELQRRQQLIRQQQQQMAQQQQQQLRYRMQLPPQSPTQMPAEQPPAPPPQYPNHGSSSPGALPPSPMTAVPAQYQPPITPTGQPPLSMSAIQNQAIVNAKTKTALANLLNHRLQGTGRGPDNGDPFPIPNRSQALQAQPPVALPDNGAPLQSQLIPTRKFEDVKPPMTVKTLPPEAPPVAPVIKVHFFGHEPQIQVPGELCLLGCIFCIQDYDKQIEPEKLDTWRKVIEQHGGEVEAEYSTKCTHVLCESQRNSVVQQAMREGKRCVTAYWLNDVLLQKKMQPPWLALHYPAPFLEEKPCKSQIITVTGFEGQERVWLKQMITSIGAKYTGYMTRQNTLVVCKTEDGVKYEKAREWRIPTVNVQWVHDVMFGHYEAQKLPMVPKYQLFDMQDHFKVDYALVPHLMAVWKVPVKITDEMWKKYLPVLNARLENGKRKLSTDEIETAPKQARSESPVLEENIPLTTANPPSEATKPRVMFTGIKQKSALMKIVYQLGGCLVSSVKDCTHLVTNKFQRTVKFLCAINVVKYVVTSEWLQQSSQQNTFVNEKPFVLSDLEGEKQFGFCLRESLMKPNRKQLFKGYVIFVTPGVYPPPSVLKDIVECAGGTVVTKRKPTCRQIMAMNHAGTKFLVVTSENDLHICRDFLNRKIGVYNAEFILTGILRQELDFKSFCYPNS